MSQDRVDSHEAIESALTAAEFLNERRDSGDSSDAGKTSVSVFMDYAAKAREAALRSTARRAKAAARRT